jgi:hypothetical protein
MTSKVFSVLGALDELFFFGLALSLLIPPYGEIYEHGSDPFSKLYPSESTQTHRI